jgi:benzoate membrane transport protein
MLTPPDESAAAPRTPLTSLTMVRFFRDLAPSTVAAGFITTLVGLASSIVIVFTAAKNLGASEEMLASWILAICFGMGILTIVPSLLLRMPAMVAWSTPGAAMMASYGAGAFGMREAIGAFLLCALVTAIVGFSGAFEKMIGRIPPAVSGALLAGLLARFAIPGFADAATAPWIVVAPTLTYIVLRLLAPRYAVIGVLAVGVLAAALTGRIDTSELQLAVARPVFTSPSLSLAAIVSIAIPLFVVTMAGQNLPGAAVIRSAQYDIPVSPMIGSCGALGVVLAPFGAYALNLSAITAAICMDPSCHEDKDRRYTAAVIAGALYMVVGVFGTSVTSALKAIPTELVHVIAALALLPTVAANLTNALRDERTRDAAVITFLVALSGVTMARIASAFWATVAGVLALGLLSLRDRRAGTVAR